MLILKYLNLFWKNKNNVLSNLKLSQKVLNHDNFRSFMPVLRTTKYGGRFTVTMIPGDGCGPQLTKYVKDIFQISNVPVDFEEVQLDKTDGYSKFIQEAVMSVRRNGVAIKGNISRDVEFQSKNVTLRRNLNLFANVVHCKSQPGIKTRHDNVDIILIRQNTEGEYNCMEHELTPGVVESLKIVTKERSEEIAHFAFKYAIQNHRKKITSVHKASVMPLTDGLFLETCISVANQYPQIKFEFIFMDTCCTKLLTNPQQFDVMLLPNLYGNVLSNIACGLIGGAGIAPGQNVGPNCIVFEIGSRSTATSLYPVAMLNASVDLLAYLGLQTHARIISNAVCKALNVEKIITLDSNECEEQSNFINRVIEIIQETRTH